MADVGWGPQHSSRVSKGSAMDSGTAQHSDHAVGMSAGGLPRRNVDVGSGRPRLWGLNRGPERGKGGKACAKEGLLWLNCKTDRQRSSPSLLPGCYTFGFGERRQRKLLDVFVIVLKKNKNKTLVV